MPSRPWSITVIPLVALALAGCENDYIEVCTPTVVEIAEAVPAAVEVSLHSGDRPLRGKPVTVEVDDRASGAIEREIEVGTDGAARIELTDEAPPGAGVTARFAGDDVYCESSATGEIGTVGADHP